MPFGPGETGNPAGKPRGAKTRPPTVPITVARQSMNAVCERAKEGDPTSQGLLVLHDALTRSGLGPLLSLLNDEHRAS